jgi:hypothetical protein
VEENSNEKFEEPFNFWPSVFTRHNRIEEWESNALRITNNDIVFLPAGLPHGVHLADNCPGRVAIHRSGSSPAYQRVVHYEEHHRSYLQRLYLKPCNLHSCLPGL